MTTATDIQKLYIAYFNRPADFDGLIYWEAQATKSGGVAAVANAFSASPEYTNLYAGKSPSQIIDTIYQNLFGRAAEPDGLTFWSTAMANGVDVGHIALAIMNGAQNADLVAVNNKAVAAAAFYAALDTNAEITGYSGDAANAVAAAWLKTITTDASLAAATTAGALSTVLSDAISAQADSPNTSIFTLTVGADTISGTSGNDTINAATVNGSGDAKTTLQAFDSVDGGAGTDTLNLYATATENTTQTGTIKNVEIVNIINADAGVNQEFGGAAAIDASKFVGATQIWQVNSDNDTGITKLAAGVTAGFRDMAANTLNVDVADAAASVTIALDNVDDASSIVVTAGAAAKLAAATISGDVVDAGTDGVDPIAVTVEAGLNVKTFSFNTAVDVALTLNENGASTANIVTFDGSASTGGIAITTDTDLVTVKTGAGADTVTLGADLAAASSIATNAGNDTVDLAGNDVAATATVSLGAGDDVFADLTGGSVVDKAAVIDGGDGADTLQLQLVGAANVAAFKNFEHFDVAGLDHDLDLDILATSNTVTTIVGSGALGADAALENVGADVGVEVTGDMGVATALTLTQKTAGALTITSNVDETAADLAANTSQSSIVAANATSLKVVFDNANVDTLADGYANTAELDIVAGSGDASASVKGATSIAVVSGGSEVVNTLKVTGVATDATGTADQLTSVTITGDQALVFDYTVSGTLKLATVDASGQTAGGLTFDLADLTATGTLKLGADDDVITGEVVNTTTVTTASLTTISGLEKGIAADATVQDGFDVIDFAGAIQGATAGTGYTLAKGLVTWTGAGPANLQAAVDLLDAGLGANEAVVFTLGGSTTFVFANGATNAHTDDTLVKLVGVTGVTGIDTVGADTHLYLF